MTGRIKFGIWEENLCKYPFENEEANQYQFTLSWKHISTNIQSSTSKYTEGNFVI